MTDLVERLRDAIERDDPASAAEYALEAADEIERLTTAVNMLLDGTAMRDAEIERLRGEIEQYRERLGLR
jgi:hypothetical protein